MGKRDFVGWICLSVDEDKPLSECESIRLERDEADKPDDAIARLEFVTDAFESYYFVDYLD